MVITTAEIARTTSKTVGQNQCRGKDTKTQESAKVQAKDGTREKATGTVPKARSSTKDKFGSKGKGSIYSVDGITESDWWTQSDFANSEEDLHFCIMEHSQDVVMDDTTNRVGATGAVKLGDQNEWRNGRFKNFLKKQRQDHCIPLRNKFQMLGTLESVRSDDDGMEAPKYVSDDDEDGR